MTKVLVDVRTNKVRGVYGAPLDFSVSGRYVVDVPDTVRVEPSNDLVADLVTAKVAGFQSLYGMSGAQNDEFLDATGVDATKSTRFSVGTGKRVQVFKSGGRLVTNILTIPGTFTQMLGHWNAFILFDQPGTPNANPSPSRLLYNYDPSLGQFAEFAQTDMTVEVRNSTDTATLLTLTPDTKMTFGGGPAFNFRLRFTNGSGTRDYYMSDWVLLYQ